MTEPLHPVGDVSRAHPRCHGPEGHVCQEPSGRTCIEKGCNEAAGTRWGPMWCPEHDMQRIDRISAGMASLVASFEAQP